MNDPICPNCRAPILSDAPGGLCPSCLLLAAALSTGGVPGGLANAPSMESVRAAFPELEILELFGHGGMGVVFKARQPRLERLVALKILPPALAVQPGFSERFIREARTLGRLSHPNIVGVYDFGERAGFYYLIMEFVNGVNLRQAMRAGVTPEQALALVPRICEALQFAHDHGVLHRDIKPENILLDTEGTPKLADFGIAKIAGATGGQSGLTQTGASLGTAVYMAPEQIERPATVDHRADIYSLGVVLYEMLTGELPLGRFAAPSEKSSVARGVDELVLRALEKERERRQQSAKQMKTDVENVTHPGTRATGTVQGPAAAPGDLGWYLGRFFIAMVILCAAMIPLAGASRRLQAIVTPATLALLCPVFGGLIAASHLLFGNRRPGPGATLLGARFWKRFAVGVSVLLIAFAISIPVIRTIRQRDSVPWQAQVPRPASAVVTPDHAPFSAKIGDGTLELMGIANSPSGGQTWWTMDGYRAAAGYGIEKRDLPMKAGERAFDVVFRRQGFPEGTTFAGYQISGGSVSSSGSLVEATAKPGEKLAGYEGLSMVLPGDARTVTIRAAVASENWHTLSDTAANNSLQGSVNYAGHEWRYQHGAASETKGGETVVTFNGTPPPDWEMGVRAVTTSGREIAPAHHSRLEDQWEWSFPTQSTDAIAEFRLQVRPIDWVEFREIVLPPVAETKAAAASAAPVEAKAPVEKPPMANEEAKHIDSLYDQNIELARKNLERLQARSDAKLVSQEELDEAGQNLAIAEARGNVLLENQARLAFLDKQLGRVHALFDAGRVSQEEVEALELKKNQVQLEIAKAQPPTAKAEPPALTAIYDEGLRLAKENLESTRKMEKLGIVVQSDVRAAERDVAIAEARGDAVLIAKARLAYAGDYLVMLQEHQKAGTVSADDVHQAEVAKNQAAAELAKAQAAGGRPPAKAETPEAKANEEEAIRLAREYVDRTRKQMEAGILSQIEVRAAECELEVAEARGDALRIAKARVAYTTDLVEVDQKRFQTGTATSAELYQAQLAHNQAKAELLKAQIAAGETPGKDR